MGILRLCADLPIAVMSLAIFQKRYVRKATTHCQLLLIALNLELQNVKEAAADLHIMYVELYGLKWEITSPLYVMGLTYITLKQTIKCLKQ